MNEIISLILSQLFFLSPTFGQKFYKLFHRVNQIKKSNTLLDYLIGCQLVSPLISIVKTFLMIAV